MRLRAEAAPRAAALMHERRPCMRMGAPAIVLYDAECGLCCRSAEFIAKRDPRGRFRLAPLDSDAGRCLLAEHGLPPGETGTVVLIRDGRVATRSTAALRIAKGLRAPWPALGALGLLVPRPVRDWAYGVVSRNRHRWFGGEEACPTPSPALRARLLDREG